LKIAVVVGTRPEIIKLAPIIKEIQRRGEHELLFVHTGQHYDTNMSQDFIVELGIPFPDYLLGVKQTKQAHQTGLIMTRFDKVLTDEKPNIVVVEGDTNSALACALAAAKNGVCKVGHIEAGCRSYDMKQQEEINRIVIDHISTINFAATLNCYNNLSNEGLGPFRSTITGHPIVDLIDSLSMHDIIPTVRDKYTPKSFALLTLHRLENIQDKDRLKAIITALNDIDICVIFPIHPHTKKQIKNFELETYINKDRIKIIEPVSYMESLALIKIAKFVITDSGGIQQEAAQLDTPCITLRDRTEWIETVWEHYNQLVHDISDLKDIVRAYDVRLSPEYMHHDIFGKVGASKRIVDLIVSNGNKK
jgi:UDP-N-acetylglucosamine 2-epimerase